MRSFVIPFLAVPVLCSAAASGAGFSGSWRTGMYWTGQAGPGSSSRFVMESPLRMMFRGRTGDLDIDAAWVIIPSIGDPALEEADLRMTGAFRTGDPDPVLASSSGDGTTVSLTHELDRLSIGLRTSFATFTAGRQAVYWGVARTVSPTDFIAPFRYGTVDTEYRTGVDALRAVFPAGMLSEVEAGIALGKDAEADSSAAWLRGRFYLLETDVTLLVARSRNDLIAGGSLNRTMGGGTGWIESSVVDPGHFQESTEGDAYWSLSAGYDRSWFNASLYGYIEYHFSSPGTDDPSDYADAAENPVISSGAVYLLGRHHLCPGLSWTPAPLWTFSTAAMVNMADPSSYLSLSGEYGIGQNTILQCGASLGLGSGYGTDGVPVSEFGSWPDLLYARAAYYF